MVGFTTRDAIVIEERMLGLERAGRGTLDPLPDQFDAATIVVRAEAASAKMGHTWKDGQRAATKALLVSNNVSVVSRPSCGSAGSRDACRL